MFCTVKQHTTEFGYARPQNTKSTMTDPETEENDRTVRENMSKALVEVQGMSYGEYLGMLRNILEDPPQAGPLIAGVTNIFSALVVFYFAYTAFSGLLSVALYAIGLWFLLAVVKWVLGCE